MIRDSCFIFLIILAVNCSYSSIIAANGLFAANGVDHSSDFSKMFNFLVFSTNKRKVLGIQILTSKSSLLSVNRCSVA